MSDQCATNGAFNKLMADLRQEMIPKVISNWKKPVRKPTRKTYKHGKLFL